MASKFSSIGGSSTDWSILTYRRFDGNENNHYRSVQGIFPIKRSRQMGLSQMPLTKLVNNQLPTLAYLQEDYFGIAKSGFVSKLKRKFQAILNKSF